MGSTWRVFSQTNDEPVHIAAGMEWLERGRYTYEPKHPPLPRILFALGPWLRGIRLAEAGNPIDQGNNLLHHQGRYSSNLSFARAGNLPFLFLGILVVVAWSRHLYGTGAALISAILFVSSAPVLGLAGLAVNDLAAASTIAAALFGFVLWLESPTIGRSVLLGICFGLALLSKFTALSYLPIALLLALVLKAVPGRISIRQAARILPMVFAVCFVFVWAIYRFSSGPVVNSETREKYDQVIPAPLRPAIHALLERSVPAPELLRGVGDVLLHNHYGHYAYLFGERSREGWTVYFPVVFAIKTPLPLLLLSLGAIPLFFIKARKTLHGNPAEPPLPTTTGQQPGLQRDRLIPLLAAVSVLGVAMTSSINIGLRHILPMYPLLAVSAGGTGMWLWNKRNLPARSLVIVLLGWQVVSAAVAHPDHLAWFNEIAPKNPEAWVLDSNVDWGQDLLRLSRELRRRRVDSLSLGYFGTAIPDRHKIPPFRLIDPYNPGEGWVAISLMNLYLRPGHENDAYFWLTREKPERIGKSILLYQVPPMERVLLPVLLGPEPLQDATGHRWTTEVSIHSLTSQPVSAFLGSSRIEIPPGRNRLVPSAGNALGGAFLDIPVSDAAHIDVSLALRENRSGRESTVPVAPLSSLRPGTQTLELPGPGGSLRIYQVAPGRKGEVLVRVRRGGALLNETPVATARFTEGGPLFGEMEIATLGLKDAQGVAVEVVPPNPGDRLWLVVVEPGSDPAVVRFHSSKPSE